MRCNGNDNRCKNGSNILHLRPVSTNTVNNEKIIRTIFFENVQVRTDFTHSSSCRNQAWNGLLVGLKHQIEVLFYRSFNLLTSYKSAGCC